MTTATTVNPRVKALDTFAARCAAAGVLSWSVRPGCPPTFNRVEGIAGALYPFFESQAVSRLLEPVACGAAARVEGPGWHARLLPRPAHASRSAGTTLIVALTPEFLVDRGLFRELCEAARVDSYVVASAISRLVHECGAVAERIFELLQPTHEDLARSARERGMINQFSDRLSQAFEETNLMFRVARMLNFESDPLRQLQATCSQLGQVLPFGWIAIRFFPEPVTAHAGELAGATVTAGTLPCAAAELDRMIDELVVAHAPDDWTKILGPGQCPLAEITGKEVLAEPIAHDGRIVGALVAGNKLGGDPDISSEEMQFLDGAAEFLGAFHENVARFSEQQAMFMGTLRALTAAIDAKDPYTRGHSERVAHLAAQMATALGLPEKEAELYRVTGLVHDIGKIGVAEAVLRKPGRLEADEFAQIKLHPEIGARILKDVGAMQDALPGVLHHHEKWDGKGYPHGLSGESIPLIARALALADSFDAMSSNRSYRTALPRDKVLAEVLRCAGTQFDPKLAPIFVDLDLRRFDELLAEHARAAA